MRTRALVSMFVLAAAVPAFAQEEDAALVEKVAVRNRLFSVDKHFELGLDVGFSMLSRLTEHYTFDAALAFNIVNTFAVELLGGYSYSRHTGLARDVASQFLGTTPGKCSNTADPTCAADLSDLWEMVGDAVIGLRWQPLYGKIGVFAELPIHFQFYLWAGGGVGFFKRESVVICNVKTGSDCVDSNGNSGYFQENQVSWLLSWAVGLRLFVPVVGQHHSVRLEIRDFLYPDSYLVGISRINALNPAAPTGGGVAGPGGVTQLYEIGIGYSYMF